MKYDLILLFVIAVFIVTFCTALLSAFGVFK
jgi:hypothetical protein